MIKKKTLYFLIFEVVVALFLVSMCILPFSSYPYRAFQKELILLEKMTIEPYFTQTFAEAIEQKDTFEATSLKVPFKKGQPLTIKRDVSISIEKDNENANGILYKIEATLSTNKTSITRTKKYFEKRKK